MLQGNPCIKHSSCVARYCSMALKPEKAIEFREKKKKNKKTELKNNLELQRVSFFRAASQAYGNSRVGGQIGATAAGHSNARSLTHWSRPGIEPKSSWILVIFLTAEPRWDTPEYIFNKKEKGEKKREKRGTKTKIEQKKKKNKKQKTLNRNVREFSHLNQNIREYSGI